MVGIKGDENMTFVKSDHSEKLLKNISSKRIEMISVAEIEGFTSERTIKVSQELDELIIQYQKLSYKRTDCISFQKYMKQTILFFYGIRYNLYNL